MKARVVMIAGLVLFAALSVVDYLQTRALIGAGGGEVYEANPVAAVWLEQHGWAGLAAFKAATAAVFVGTVLLVAARRPRVSAGLVAAACLTLSLVTFRSGDMLAAAERQPAEDVAAAWERPARPLPPMPPPRATPSGPVAECR